MMAGSGKLKTIKIPCPMGRGFFQLSYTSWTIAISAASPRRGPIFTIRV